MNNGRKTALWGAWLQLGLVLGLGGTIINMVNAFSKFSDSQGEANTEVLAGKISSALIPSAVGMGVALVGVILMGIALLGMKYRAKWFFGFLIIYGVMWTLYMPTGTIAGGALLAFLFWKKDEFVGNRNQHVNPPT